MRGVLRGDVVSAFVVGIFTRRVRRVDWDALRPRPRPRPRAQAGSPAPPAAPSDAAAAQAVLA